MAEPFIGQTDTFGFNFVPQNWADCSGAIMQISNNQALYSLLGTAYGGDGRSTFALPDLRGKMALSQGNYPGSQYEWKVGNTRGSEAHTMNNLEMPAHLHAASFTATSSSPSVNITATTDDADADTPSAGSYLALGKSGQDNINIYKTTPTPEKTVDLGGVTVSGGGGVTSGTVVVNSTGSNTRFNIIQPTLVLNYSIAMLGLFPSRN